MAKDKDDIEEEISEDSEESEENGEGEAELLEREAINFKDLDEDRVIGVEISNEMKRAYIDYAMSVIVARALPSVEDGLKPVHRRILYAMDQMGLSKGPTKKSARIVGDTMGKFHPHGDMAIYDAMVRMAQDFSLRYPLVHGQGNFGCFTADTKVALTDGRNLSFLELIKENQGGKRNFTFTVDEKNEIKIAEIKNPRKTRENAEIMKVILDNGEEIKCTLNHKFMLKNGTYKEAKDLESGDSLMPCNINHSNNDNNLLLCEINGNHKVVSIEFLKEYVDVYDLTIDKTHNFALASGIFVHNSMDGDNAAASRYTEAKLAKIAVELLLDIDKETVKFIPNFDNSTEEPLILPGKVPNLLINGSSGIAVGMTTNIPPHNLTEVCDGIIKTIEKPDITIDELMEIIQGPDFPTGGQIVGNTLKELYENGKAGFIIRGKVTTETKKEREQVVITQIPYQVNKSELVKQIAELVRDKKLLDVSDIRDESAKGNVRIVIEMKKGANSQFAINRLYKSTRLQTKFDAVMVALVAGVPKRLNLKEMINCYIDHRRKIIRKRTDFDLKKAEDREHIVKGLLIALKNLDEIIETIKKSKEDALENLMKKFGFTKKQAEAILETKLRQLTSLEHDKLKKEEQELIELIDRLKKILADEKEILKIIKFELNELKKNFGDERRCRIIRTVKEIEEKDLIQKKEVVITITDKGYIKRMPFRIYHEQKRGGKGVIGAELTSEDFVKQLITCSTHDNLLLFTARGRLFWLKAYKVPETQRYGKGQAIVNLLNIKDDTVTSVMAVKDFSDYLFMVTKLGQVKKIRLEMFSKPRNSGVRIINLPLDNTDSVVDVKRVKQEQEVMLISRKGQAIRFNSKDVRDMGRASYGVCGIKMDKNDDVVSMEIAESIKQTVLTITEKGYGKRSMIEDYRLTGRAGKGVINLKISHDKTGDVVSTITVDDKDKFIVSTKKGIVIRTNVKEIRVMGRATQGVRIIKLHEGDKVVDIAKISNDDEIPSGDGGENGQKGIDDFEKEKK